MMFEVENLKTWSQKVTYQSHNIVDLRQAQAFAEDNTRSWEDIEAELGGQKLQGPSTCLDVSWSQGLMAEAIEVSKNLMGYV